MLPIDRFPTAASLLAQEMAADDRGFLQRMLENPLLLPVGLIAIFYVTFFGPERRRKAEEAKRLAAIAKNDRVVTVGGIHGVVVDAAAGSETVTLRIDEKAGTRIKVNRSAVTAVTVAKSEETGKTVASAK